ncbi:SDR family oxidoreductase [Flavobacterium sufflavum]|uniref:SDR family oxidoreductase n=1 Tax=Flavobacterium sufflavum TaxID=1921138 RepID=A0A3S2UHF4_9FLAO|nr:SDR family oxidoreductase [Flavobacterium sufflavum]RVT74385.1 SDR family oxidoreductase [Flavobacterium sufflavum]
MNLFDIKDKVAVITGGTGVLGCSVAKHLAASGAKVVILGRNQETIDKSVAALKENGYDALGVEANVLDKESLEGAKNNIISHYGKVDVLLNAAGGNMPGATINEDQTIFDLSIDAFQTVTDLNLNGTVIPSIVFGELMAKQKEGIIINFSSMTVERAVTRVVGYSASKAAMENFTRWMAVEMATKFSDKIRVNAIAPGFFIGNQNRRLLTNEDGTYSQRGNSIINNTPMKRFGEADELAGAIHFLCSEASKFITGIVLPVDGGFSAFSGV